MRTLHRPIALLALLLAACSSILFVFPVLTLYDSQWLPGFLIALIGSTIGVFFLLPYRRQSSTLTAFDMNFACESNPSRFKKGSPPQTQIQYGHGTTLYAVSLYAAPVVLVLHLLLFTPVGSMFGT